MTTYIIIAVAIIIILIILYVIVTFNNLIKSKNKVAEAFATMDVYLKKRWDLIPNLVETVKGYATHESELLQKVVELRNKSYDSISNVDKIELNTKLSQDISKLIALSESYPELKSNTNFIDLNNKLTQIENDIATSRKYYNATIKEQNNLIEMFPSNIVAKLFGYKTQKMFEATSSERENIKIEL